MDGVSDLVPQPAPDEAYKVVATLRRGEKTTGGDVGILAFSEGWLVYEGRTTAFSLSVDDVRRHSVEGVAWTLVLSQAQSLTLKSHDPSWRGAMRRWLDAPAPEGISHLPPLEPSPIHRLRPAGYMHLGASLLAGMSLAAFFRPTGVRGAIVFATIAALLYAWGLLRAKRPGPSLPVPTGRPPRRPEGG